MGFLDRLAADLIAGKGGKGNRNVHRLVRKAGGGKLLLMGAAAMAFEQYDQQQEQKATTGTGAPPPPLPATLGSTPPLPPVPMPTPSEAAKTVPMPLPPIPDGDDPADDAAPERELGLPAGVLFPVVRAMVAAALADGLLHALEKQAIEKHLDHSDLTYDQVQQVHRDLLIPPSIDELGEMVTSLDDAEVVYRFAALVVKADGEVTEGETSWLRRLADRLEIDDELRRSLEAELLSD